MGRAARETPDGIVAMTALLQRPGATLEALAEASGLGHEDAARTLGALALDGDVEIDAARRFRVGEGGLKRFEAHVRRIARAIGEPDGEGPLEHCPTFPLPMRTTWQSAICWNWAVDPARLRPLVPEPLEIEVAHDRAWVTVAMSRLDDMRPSYLPKRSGWNFYQISYRAHVRYTDFRGEVRRGCYFVRSYTNSPLMNAIGNALPEFRFHEFRTAAMTMMRSGGTLLASVDPPEGDPCKMVTVLDEARRSDSLPATSRFRDLADAYATLVEVYDAYGWEPADRSIYVLTIDRGEWQVRMPRVESCYDGTFAGALFDDASAQLDSVFTIKGVPYAWRPLRRERIP